MLAQKLINSANVSGMDFIQLACQQYGWHFPVHTYASQDEKIELNSKNPEGLVIDINLVHGYSLSDLFQTAKTIWWFKSFKASKYHLYRLFSTITPIYLTIVKLYTFLYVLSGLNTFFKLQFFSLPLVLDQGVVLAATWVVAFILASFYWLVLSRISLSIVDLIGSVLGDRFNDQELSLYFLRREDLKQLVKSCFPVIGRILISSN